MFRWLRALVAGGVAPVPRLSLAGGEIRFEDGLGKSDRVNCADLAAVVIETNDSGPWLDDVIWHLLGRNEGHCLSIPQSVEGFSELLTRLQALPGFDNREVVAAMGSASLNAFLCWEADARVRPDSAVLGFARLRRQADPPPG